MLDKSLFVSDALHERTVSLPDGSTHTMHFRELPHTEFRKFIDAERSEDENVRAASGAKLIAASLCEPDGKRAVTEKQAAQLKASAANSIVTAIMEVNGYGSKKDSPPEERDGSGTSSPSPLADEASLSGSLS